MLRPELFTHPPCQAQFHAALDAIGHTDEGDSPAVGNCQQCPGIEARGEA